MGPTRGKATPTDAALAGGGHVTGVITERLKAKGHTHQHLNAVEILPTMQARKKRMIALADAFIALPRGFCPPRIAGPSLCNRLQTI